MQTTARSRPGIGRFAGVVVALIAVALGWFYVVAASEHGVRVNLSKARGDQSGYLWDAENVYANRHGREPRTIIGERNRMPLYAGYLALFYHQGLGDPEFFEVAKRANIYLSLALLVLLGLVLKRTLPAHAAMNLTLVVTFGYFIYKAGYAQAELLFYFLFFVTFLGCCYAFVARPGLRAVGTASLAGAVAALAHLTKAALPPFVAIFLVVFALEPIAWLRQPTLLTRVSSQSSTHNSDPFRAAVWRWVAAAAFAAAFLAVLSPYLTTSKRVFGQYFYNVNSTFYVWCDDWKQASVLTRLHGDGIGWPTMPEDQLPGPAKYWREHSVAQIADRLASGFRDIAVVSYTTYDILVYLALYLVAFAALVLTRWTIVASMARDHAWLTAFILMYGAAYALATAFYFPTSGTGTGRFFLAHVLPLLFVLSFVFANAARRAAPWAIGGMSLDLSHVNVAVTCVLALDVFFRTWPRLMTTYGGF